MNSRLFPDLMHVIFKQLNIKKSTKLLSFNYCVTNIDCYNNIKIAFHNLEEICKKSSNSNESNTRVDYNFSTPLYNIMLVSKQHPTSAFLRMCLILEVGNAKLGSGVRALDFVIGWS